ncbi:MAG: glyoxalase superfamily protein [Roseobacter sp.]
MRLEQPSIQQAKNQAKQLRSQMAAKGTQISHAKSLELISNQHGFRDWNTMIAEMSREPSQTWSIGDKVHGSYLSQPFSARVANVTEVKPGWFKLELHFDDPVDVVAFDSFSNLRSRICGVVGPKGYSAERTGNGQAQLQIDLASKEAIVSQPT